MVAAVFRRLAPAATCRIITALLHTSTTVSVTVGLGYSKCPTKSGIGVQRVWEADFNAGFGPSGGFTIQSDGSGGVGGSRGLKGGLGYGVQASGGVGQVVTIATPPFFGGRGCGCK